MLMPSKSSTVSYSPNLFIIFEILIFMLLWLRSKISPKILTCVEGSQIMPSTVDSSLVSLWLAVR